MTSPSLEEIAEKICAGWYGASYIPGSVLAGAIAAALREQREAALEEAQTEIDKLIEGIETDHPPTAMTFGLVAKSNIRALFARNSAFGLPVVVDSTMPRDEIQIGEHRIVGLARDSGEGK